MQKAINEKQVKINGKEIKETGYPVGLFDIIELIALKKKYKAGLSDKKKMIFEEISGGESEVKVLKIIGKKILRTGKVQLNLMDGRNVLAKEEVSVGDSVVFNFKSGKIDSVIKMEKGKEGYVISGKHAGKKGKIESIIERGGKKLAKISVEGVKLNVWVKNVIVM